MELFTQAERYDRHAHRLGRRLYDRVVADAAGAGLPDDARVLDVGTGPGRIARSLAHDHPTWTVEAVDLSPQMIEYARAEDPHGTVTFTVGDVAALPYPDAHFDLIVSSMSQHHWADVAAGLRDLRRVLRPGGRLWIYDGRFALGRARRLAERTFPDVRREPVHLTWWLPVVARLSARIG